VLLHLLETSKTGLTGISRGVARAIEAAAPGHVLALVDASEGRAYAMELRRDLAQGMMVLVSGAHFVGGPPTSAALLLPHTLVAQLGAAPNLLPSPVNPGLALRWCAALAELTEYQSVDEALRREILELFTRKTRAMAARRAFISLDCASRERFDDPLRDSIITLIPLTPQGPHAPVQYAAAIQRALAEPCNGLSGDAACHVGGPIEIGDRAALTIAASAPMISAVARRIQAGHSFERAMAPVLRDLETVFRKWEALAG
jgi:hypothetical protein